MEYDVCVVGAGINNLLDNDIEFVGLRNILRVMSPKGDITLVNDKEKTLEILESLAPNSGEPLRNFISLAEECREALDYITKNIDNLDMDYIHEEYNGFFEFTNFLTRDYEFFLDGLW